MKILILCTGNSCRSIMAEALIKKEFPNIVVKSAGSNPSGKVNPNAIKVLKEENAWKEEFYSKSIEEVSKFDPFDLVITVCDNAKEACPVYPNTKKQLHVPFPDPDGKDYSEFLKVKEQIKQELLPIIKKELNSL